MKEAKRQQDVKQQAATAAARRAKCFAQHLKRNEAGKKRSKAAQA